MADQEGISLEHAIDRYGWQSAFSRLASSVRTTSPGAFAGARIEDTGGSISFKGAVPDEAQYIIDSFRSDYGGVTVELHTDMGYSETEVDAAVKAVHYALLRESDVADVGTSFESETATVIADVVLAGPVPDTALAELTALAQEKVAALGLADRLGVTVTRTKSVGGDDGDIAQVG